MTNEQYWLEAKILAMWNEAGRLLTLKDFCSGLVEFQKPLLIVKFDTQTGVSYRSRPSEIDQAEADSLIRSVGCKLSEESAQ